MNAIAMNVGGGPLWSLGGREGVEDFFFANTTLYLFFG
jgi:hypothetical protein